MNEIGQRIKTVRIANGHTHQFLADKIFVSRQVVNAWETGRSGMNADSLKRLCDFYNVSADYILGREGEYENVEKKLLVAKLEEVQMQIQSLIASIRI